LDPNDKTEKVLLSTLMNSEKDLHDYAGQPMAFPVFGRGRALYALVGKGIERRNLEDAALFLAGPCACEIKRQNPGVDLLIAARWEAGDVPLIAEIELPPLTGVIPQLPDTPVAAVGTPREEPAAPTPAARRVPAPPPVRESREMGPATLAAIGLSVLVVGVLAVSTWMFLARSRDL
jgi:hypothetical protein